VRATMLLVRHATCAQMTEFLNGRTRDVPLTRRGWREARLLARCLALLRGPVVISSPLRRARDTAAAIAAPHAVPVRIDAALDEVDFGRWSGASFAHLAHDPQWRTWNHDRAHSRAPGGETMYEVQRRALGLVKRLARQHSEGVLVLVTHAEVIRAVLLHIGGLPLDQYVGLEIAPASVSRLSAAASGLAIESVNETFTREAA